MAIKALLEVVQTGAKNIEISVVEKYGVVVVRGLCVTYSLKRLTTVRI